MEKIKNIHPGEILEKEFLTPLNLSSIKLANEIHISLAILFDLINGKIIMTSDIALRLSSFFGNSAKFWLGIQDDFDLEESQIQFQNELSNIKKFEYKK